MCVDPPRERNSVQLSPRKRPSPDALFEWRTSVKRTGTRDDEEFGQFVDAHGWNPRGAENWSSSRYAQL